MANGKIPNINNKFYGEKLVEVTFPDSTSSLGFDEYNAVLNNVNSSVSSSIIMDADYALNARIPTNNDRLLSGTAQRMEIQDSNYSSVAWTSPRYVGSQTISATYNDYQASGSSVTFADGTVGPWKGDQVFNEYPGDETFTRGNPLGKIPAVDLYSTHFVLFDKIEIDSAVNDRDVFHCLYLIDDQGNKVPLTYKNKNLVDLRRLYVQGSNAEVVFLGQNDQEVLDEYPVERVGIVRFQDFSIENDLFLVDQQVEFLYPSNNAPNSDAAQDGGAASTRFVFQWNRQGNQPDISQDFTRSSILYSGIPITPGLFEATNIGGQTYRLKYGDNSINFNRFDLLNNNFHIGCSQTYKAKLNPNLNSSYYILKFSQYSNGENTQILWDDPYSISPPPNTLVKPTGSYVNGNNTIFQGTYALNENKLDPYYALTYNKQTKKVFENTIYETVIKDAQFASSNPIINDIPTNAGIVSPTISDGTMNVNLLNTPMPPISSLGNSNIPALTIQNSLTWANADILTGIDLATVDPIDPTPRIKEELPSSIQAETTITDISLGKINTQRIYHNGTTDSSITPFSPPGSSTTIEFAGGGIFLGMATDSFSGYYHLDGTSTANGGDINYPDNLKYRYPDASISTSLENVASNDSMSCGMIVGNVPMKPPYGPNLPSTFTYNSGTSSTNIWYVTASFEVNGGPNLMSEINANSPYTLPPGYTNSLTLESNQPLNNQSPTSFDTYNFFPGGTYEIDVSGDISTWDNDYEVTVSIGPTDIPIYAHIFFSYSTNQGPEYEVNQYPIIRNGAPGTPGATITVNIPTNTTNFKMGWYWSDTNIANPTPTPFDFTFVFSPSYTNPPLISTTSLPPALITVPTEHALFGRPTHAWSSINPGDIHMLYLPTKSGYNNDNSSYAVYDQSAFYETLCHGDVIELTDTDYFNRTTYKFVNFMDMVTGAVYGDPNSVYGVSSWNESSPQSNPRVWRFMILRAPDKYDSNLVNGGGSGEGERGCYRFYVKYLNGRTDSLSQDYPKLSPLFFDVVLPYPPMNSLSMAENISYTGDQGFVQTGIETYNRKVICLYSIKKMDTPYIDVLQTQGNNLDSVTNNQSTILSVATEKEHEQYIESQNLIGTGVGALLPDNYDPKLREQLPDIINKTGIDINSLVQGNN